MVEIDTKKKLKQFLGTDDDFAIEPIDYSKSLDIWINKLYEDLNFQTYIHNYNCDDD
jgi:hypothetical protein